MRRTLRLAAALVLVASTSFAQVFFPPAWSDDSVTARAPLGGDQSQLDATGSMAGTVAVWVDQRAGLAWGHVYGALIQPVAVFTPGRGTLLGAGVLAEWAPAIACNADECLLAWASSTGLKTRRLSSAAVPLEQPVVRTPDLVSTIDVSASTPSGPFRVVYSSNGQIFTFTTAAPTPVLVSGANFSQSPVVGWNGSEYCLAYEDLVLGLRGRSANAGTLGTEISLSASTSAREPRFANRVGACVLTWVDQQVGYEGPIRASLFTGSTATMPTTVFSGLAALDTTVTRASGMTIIGWHDVGYPTNQFARVLFDDGGLSAPVTFAVGLETEVQTSLIDGPGGVRAVWLETNRTERDVFTRVFNPLTGVGTDAGTLEPAGEWHRAPNAAGWGDGGGLIVWEAPPSSDAGFVEVRGVRLNALGQPLSEPRTLARGGDLAFQPLLVPGLQQPALVWAESLGLFTAERPLWLTRLNEALQPSAPVRLNLTSGCCQEAPFAVPANGHTWVMQVDYDSQLNLRGVRVAPDGTLLDPPGRVLVPNCTTEMHGVWVERAGRLWVAGNANGFVGGASLTATGAPGGVTWGSLGFGSYPSNVRLASDGTGLLMVWVDAVTSDATAVTAQFVDPMTGAPSGVQARLVANQALVGVIAKPSVLFDGREYVVTVEYVANDAGTKVDVFRFGPAFANLTRSTASSGTPADDGALSLSLWSPGRVAISGLRLDPRAGVARSFVQLTAKAVPAGAFCVDSSECAAGSCISACCSLDGGPCSGGADGGVVFDGGATLDAGMNLDGGVNSDGGADLDGGANPDGGTNLDGGADLDGGAGLDGGANSDGGVDVDGGPNFDAGTDSDAGVVTDGGAVSPDGGTERMSFNVGCGCTSVDVSAVLFALVAFMRRRRQPPS